jgi:hypothetical protein
MRMCMRTSNLMVSSITHGSKYIDFENGCEDRSTCRWRESKHGRPASRQPLYVSKHSRKEQISVDGCLCEKYRLFVRCSLSSMRTMVDMSDCLSTLNFWYGKFNSRPCNWIDWRVVCIMMGSGTNELKGPLSMKSARTKHAQQIQVVNFNRCQKC